MAANKEYVENLQHEKAIEKIKEFVKHEHTCMFTTNLSRIPLQARPMSTLKIDDDGNLWFLSATDSDKNRDIKKDERVQLFYSNSDKFEFLSLYGHASISKDSQKIRDLWSAMAKAWFEGKDDPNISVIRVTPDKGYYWNTKDNKMIFLAKMAAAMASGESPGGVKGELRV